MLMKFSNIHSMTRIRTIIRDRSDPQYARVFADLYWRGLLIIATLVVIGVAAYGASTFFGTLSQLNPIAGSGSPAPVPTAASIDRGALDATIAGFAARQAQFQALQQNPIPPIADPAQ
jgi:hypothetical protein